MTPATVPFAPPVALASLSGRADAAWARRGAPHAGAAFLGGICVDAPTREAARTMTDRGRTEFLPDDPLAFIDDQLRGLRQTPIVPGVNVRSTGPESTEAAAAVCRRHGAIVEINAHCRQTEMCAAGAGESLLREPSRLAAQVCAAARAGPRVSVKLRAELDDVSVERVGRQAVAAGADLLHLDAMDSPDAVGALAPLDAEVIANNGVRDLESVATYLRRGADAVSVGRPSTDPAALDRIATATKRWHREQRHTQTQSHSHSHSQSRSHSQSGGQWEPTGRQRS